MFKFCVKCHSLYLNRVEISIITFTYRIPYFTRTIDVNYYIYYLIIAQFSSATSKIINNRKSFHLKSNNMVYKSYSNIYQFIEPLKDLQFIHI